MTATLSDCVWLSGERYNVDYLFDTGAGTVRKKVVSPERAGTTGGLGRRCGRKFVAVYVAPERDRVLLQVDSNRFVLDGATIARHRRRLGGLVSELVISRPGEADLTVRQPTVGAALQRRADPAYDALDEVGDDFLADVADIVNTRDRREWLLEVKDPAAGPW